MSDDPTKLTADPSDVSHTAESLSPETLTRRPEARPIESSDSQEAKDAKPAPENTLTDIKLEKLPLISDSEPNIERFIEQSYTSPTSARMASQSLIETFDDKGLWLASLVQPAHLAAELRQQCSELSSLVIMQWVRQGETHKLKLLSETLLAEPPARRTRETARIMAVLAGLLGILRPSTAQKLINCAIPYLSDLADGSLLRDARQWVEAGRVLEQSSPEERIFWNRHLREPGNDWDWDSAEARLALRHLADILPSEGQALHVFQGAVPGYWWDLWRNPRAAPHDNQLALMAASSNTRKSGGFGPGLIIGIAATLAIGWFSMSYWPPRADQASAAMVHQSPISGKATPIESASSTEEETPQTPPIRESLRQLQSVLKQAPPAQVGQSKPEVQPFSTPQVGNASAPLNATAPSSQPKSALRAAALAKHAAANLDARRLVSLVKNSSYRENATLIQGGNSVAPRGSPTYQGLIHWLILDPPQHADVRLAVTKLALHSLPVEDTISLFDLCYYPGSPNEIEIKQCSNLLLELPDTSITGTHRVILNKIISMQ
jgi:hypothetical protein